jgi:phenol 2-monooxygenase
MVDDPNATDYPITVKLRPLPPAPTNGTEDAKSGLYRSNLFATATEPEAVVNGAEEETVKARYMVGCDGARSWVRK